MVRITVRTHPGASREKVQWEGETLHIWVSQRAVEGAANRAVIEAVARMFGVGSSSVTIGAGRRGRDKVLVVEGVDSKNRRPRRR